MILLQLWKYQFDFYTVFMLNQRDIHFQFFSVISTERDIRAAIAQNICVKLKLNIWFYVSQILFINSIYNRKEGKGYLIFHMNIDLNSTEEYS